MVSVLGLGFRVTGYPTILGLISCTPPPETSEQSPSGLSSNSATTWATSHTAGFPAWLHMGRQRAPPKKYELKSKLPASSSPP